MKNCINKIITYMFMALSVSCTEPSKLSSDSSLRKPYHDCQAQNGDIKLTILHSNDHHGWFWKNRYGEWGMGARKTLIDRIRSEVANEGGCTLLLSAGDVFTGTPASDYFNAEPDFLGMTLLGYDAMTVGNHEFDKGVDVLLEREAQVQDDFPMISGNITKENGDLLFPGDGGDGQVSFNISGAKVTVWGLTTIDTKVPQSSGLTVHQPTDVAREKATSLKEDSHVLVGLTHMGHYPNEKPEAGPSQRQRQGDVMLALNNPNVFDIIVGGHSQLPLFEADKVAGTYIVQAYEWGKYLGRIDLVIGENPVLGAQNIKSLDYKLLPVNIRDDAGNCIAGAGEPFLKIPCLEEDQEVIAALEPYQKDEALSELYEKIGRSEDTFSGERSVIRKKQAPLGQLVNRAIDHKVQSVLQADFYVESMHQCKSRHFSIYNGGGIRSSLNEGDVLGLDAKLIFPFGTKVITTEMSYQQLVEYMSMVSQIPYNPKASSGDYPQVFGLRMKLEDGKLRDIECLNSAGEWISLNENDSYYLSLGAYVHGGGDGSYPSLVLTEKSMEHKEAMFTIFADYIKTQSVLRLEDYPVNEAFKEVNVP